MKIESGKELTTKDIIFYTSYLTSHSRHSKCPKFEKILVQGFHLQKSFEILVKYRKWYGNGKILHQKRCKASWSCLKVYYEEL